MPAPLAPPCYPELAAEIARTGLSQISLASSVRCVPATISQIIHGHLRPSPDIKRRIAVALNRDEGELFALHPDVQRLVDLASDQGMPERVADAATIARVAALVGGGADAPTS